MTFELASIVLPVQNQADHVESVVRGFQESLQRLPPPTRSCSS